MKTEFKLICGDVNWKLVPSQHGQGLRYPTPRGFRHEGKRPNKIKVQILEEFDLDQLDHLIGYLIDLRDTME